MDIKEFFESDYVSYGAYDSVRKIASYIDGQKNSSRKVIHTLINQNINTFVKVSNLGPKVQEYTQYLHGSIEGIIVRMAQDYVGSNNIPLVQGDGSFGTMFIPTASATRYIFARKGAVLDKLFDKEDYTNLLHQNFEGDKIEPRFYVPTLPLIAINGSEGLAVGFSQKILPRKAQDVHKAILELLNGYDVSTVTPHYNGMLCDISQGENDRQWVINGTFKRLTSAKIQITSLPIGYNLKDYQTVLNNLVDSKVIKDYDDNSDDDVFDFVVYAEKSFVAQSDEAILKKLKLTKTVTENYTCLDEHNKIKVFDSFVDILKAWLDIRLVYNQKRIDSILETLRVVNKEYLIKHTFIQLVLQGKVVINNRTDEEIKDSIVQHCDISSDLLPVYGKLMSIPLKQFTAEEVKRLQKQIADNKKEIERVKSLSPKDLILEDMEKVVNILK